jgi:hypothetical protein
MEKVLNGSVSIKLDITHQIYAESSNYKIGILYLCSTEDDPEVLISPMVGLPR